MKMLLSRTDTEHLSESCIHFGLFYDTNINGEEILAEIEDYKILLWT